MVIEVEKIQFGLVGRPKVFSLYSHSVEWWWKAMIQICDNKCSITQIAFCFLTQKLYDFWDACIFKEKYAYHLTKDTSYFLMSGVICLYIFYMRTHTPACLAAWIKVTNTCGDSQSSGQLILEVVASWALAELCILRAWCLSPAYPVLH